MTRTVLKLTAVTLSAIAVFVISNRTTQAELGAVTAVTVEPQDKPVEQVNPISTRIFSEMKLNVAVDDAKFNMPAATP